MNCYERLKNEGRHYGRERGVNRDYRNGMEETNLDRSSWNLNGIEVENKEESFFTSHME